MNWGYKIFIVIIIFILAMLAMVYTAMRQTNEMEDANYYEKELQYQSKIDAAQNLNAVSLAPMLLQSADQITLQIPADLTQHFKNGKVEFLRSDDQKKDFHMPMALDTSGAFAISKGRFTKGLYKARIAWENGSTQYYRETSIFIKP